MKKFLDVQYSNYEETLVDIYLPENDNYKTIVNFHGGSVYVDIFLAWEGK